MRADDDAATLERRLRVALKGTRAGRDVSGPAVAALVAAICTALPEYRARRRWAPGIATATEAARDYADAVRRLTRELGRLLDHRWLRVRRRQQGFVSVGMSPEHVFTIRTHGWRRALAQWEALAHAESQRRTRRRGAPRDEPLLWLACIVADALDHVGIRPTTAKGGALAKVLGHAVFPAIGLDGRDPQTVVKDAPHAWRAWPTKEQRGK